MSKKKRKPSELKRAGRTPLSEIVKLPPRMEKFAVLVSSGMTLELASIECGSTFKETSRWLREVAPLQPRIAELRNECYQEVAQQTLSQYLTLLRQISDQLQKKVDGGESISIKELKAAFSLHNEVGSVLQQHERRKEEAGESAVARGKGFYVAMDEPSMFELWAKTKEPGVIEYTKGSFVRWYEDLSRGDQNDMMARLQKAHN